MHASRMMVWAPKVPPEPSTIARHGQLVICFPSYCQVPINTAGWTGAMWVKFLAQRNNSSSWASNLRLLDQQALTTRYCFLTYTRTHTRTHLYTRTHTCTQTRTHACMHASTVTHNGITQVRLIVTCSGIHIYLRSATAGVTIATASYTVSSSLSSLLTSCS